MKEQIVQRRKFGCASRGFRLEQPQQIEEELSQATDQAYQTVSLVSC